LILKTSYDFTVSSKSRLKITDKKSRRVIYDSHGKQITLNPSKISSPMIVESTGGLISVNQKEYRGNFEFHNLMGKVYAINIVSVEEYLMSVVPSEIPALWEPEALKAQAVAARTYAYYHLFKKNKKSLYDVDASTNFQVYRGASVEKEPTTRAVNDTAGEIIMFRNEPVLAYFHSTCGGHTVDDRHVWERSDHKYLEGVTCRYCGDSPTYNWKTVVSLDELRQKLSTKYRSIGQIKNIRFHRASGRVTAVDIGHTGGKVKLSGNDFRLLFPGKRILSTYFKSRYIRDGLIIRGKGWGHGVGLCQWGSRGMARSGADYKTILKHYYSHITVDRLSYRSFIAGK